MKYLLEFELFGLPRMTNPSGRPTHWAVRAKEAKFWKERVARTVAAHRPEHPLKRARLELTRISSVSPDSDGLVSGFKHVIDGLVVAGVLENDRVANIGMPQYRWERCKPGLGKIRILVESIDESNAVPNQEGPHGY